MVTAVPSRFAVLSIEDDDYKPKKPQKVKLKTNAKIKEDSNQNKIQSKKEDKKKQSKGKKKKNAGDGHQWEQWKKKDSETVEETYEQELHEAILLSKLSYQKSQVEGKSKMENNQENTKKSHSKKSKKSTMTLEEFNNLDVTTPTIVPKIERKNSSPKEDDKFFEKIDKEANEELIKEKENAALIARVNQLDDNISSTQLKAEIEKRDSIIKVLQVEVENLKEELSNVKNRNKRLYQILQQGEMKDKAAVLAEVTKLQEIREELTSEVSSLHAQLEQERSKTRASNVDTKTTKQNSKKKLASDI